MKLRHWLVLLSLMLSPAAFAAAPFAFDNHHVVDADRLSERDLHAREQRRDALLSGSSCMRFSVGE